MINLSRHLRRLVVTLVASIGVALLLMLGSYFFGWQHFQQTEQRSTAQLLALISIQKYFVQANRMFDHRTFQPDARDYDAIADMWRSKWEHYDQLLPAYQQTLKPHLVRLELGHWRVLDIYRQSLHNADRAVFEQLIVPQMNALFEACTALVNMTRAAKHLPALGHAADMRGYLTKASQALAVAQQSDADPEWLAYFDAMQQFSRSQTQLAELDDLNTAVRSVQQGLLKQVERMQANAFVLRRLNESSQYFDVGRQLVINRHVTGSMARELDYLFNDIRLTREALREDATQRFIWTCALIAMAVVVLMLSLFWWRRRLNLAIVEPIKRIVENSHRIATGQTTEIAEHDSGIVEMQQLTDAITLIRDIVSSEQQRVQQQRRLQECFEALNTLLHQSESLAQFSQQALDLVVARSGALAGALFLKTEAATHQEPLLVAQVNISAQMERHYQQHFDGLPQQVFKSRVAIEEILESDGVRIHSSLTERKPAFHCVFPLASSHDTLGVLELLYAGRDDYPKELVRALVEKLAVLMQSLLSAEHTRELLTKTQKQKRQLDDAMTELKSQTHALQQSEAELEMQADELKVNNLELRRQAEASEKQKRELEKLNERLHRASRELQEASNQKTAFLSKVSHELRTPLNSIMVLTQVLLKQDNTLTEEQKQSLSVIRNSGEDLLTLVNDLLDLARIEAGKMKFHFDALRVRDLTNRLKGQFQPLAQEKSLGWHVQVAEDVPEVVVSDVQRLAQVLRNFLSNAFKFTGEGKVVLHVSVQGSYIVFEVEDSGIGISSEDQSLIFESFSQIDAPVGAAQPGSGLGLSIARQIAESLGGYITVTSTKGQGSRFALFVPLDAPSTDPNADDMPKMTTMVGSLEPPSSPRARGSQAKLPAERANQSEGVDRPHWAVVSDIAAEITALQALLGAHAVLTVLRPEACAEQVPETLRGMIIRGDRAFGASMQALQQQLVALREQMKVVVVVEHALHNDNDWLAGLAHHLIRWNDAGREQLLQIVLPNQKAGDTEATDSVAHERTGDFGVAGAKDSGETTPDGQGRHILLLDDDMRSLFSTGMALKQAGYVTELSDSVTLAKQRLHTFPAELVVTDLVLPGEDGFGFIEYLKQHKAYEKLPVIVLSAKDNREDKQRCEALGVNAYVSKPASLPDLLNAIAAVLDQHAHPENSDESRESVDDSSTKGTRDD